jgi:hypothetical protein
VFRKTPAVFAARPLLYPCVGSLVPLAQAQTVPSSDILEEVIVTAQKVTEKLQHVPISIEAIGTQNSKIVQTTKVGDIR